jgi:hypothetical protein
MTTTINPKCGIDNCPRPASFHVFDAVLTEAVADRALCEHHARSVIDQLSRECAKARVPPFWEKPKEFKLAHIVGSFQSSVAVVYLHSSDGSYLSFHTGKLEAWTLLSLLTRQTRTNRPLTHEAMASAIEALGGTLKEVVIDDLIDDAFHAKLHLCKGNDLILTDLRPSDAIALAFVRNVPILVAPSALRKAKE